MSVNIAVLVSGRGVALGMTLRACAVPPAAGSVVAVAGSIDCPALDVARQASVPHVRYFDQADYPDRRTRAQAQVAFLQRAGVDLVFTAGYSDVVDPELTEAFPDRVMSIYPSLLPAWGDEIDTIAAPLARGVKLIGVTYHLREPMERSAGPIIAQRAIPVDIDDTVESVEPVIAEAEESLLVEVLQAFGEDRVSVEGTRVRIRPRLEATTTARDGSGGSAIE